METGSSTVDDDGPQRLGLLASALAGRTVAVAPGDRGDPAWTDGITVFVDPAESAGQQLEAVTVQASLLAGGGLEPDVVRKLLRRPALAKKYLAVEGQRSLAANEDLLPLPVRSLIDLDLATRTDSPATSLDRGRKPQGCRSTGQLRRDQGPQPAGGAPKRAAVGCGRRPRPSS